MEKKDIFFFQITGLKSENEKKELIKTLVQDGYSRILVAKDIESMKQSSQLSQALADFDVIELTDPQFKKRGGIPANFYVVVDRLSFDAEEEGRLFDSVNLGFSGSIKYSYQKNQTLFGRALYVMKTDQKFLRFTEEETCPYCEFQPPQLTSKLFNFNSPNRCVSHLQRIRKYFNS